MKQPWIFVSLIVLLAFGSLGVSTIRDGISDARANGPNQPILTTADGKFPAVDGSEITGIGALAVPAGAMVDYGAASAPSGWLLCDGAAVSRTTYATLFTAIGTTYGVGDGSTTFNVPDFRGRTAVTIGTHADVDALGDSDAVAVGSRTPNHAHGPGNLAGTTSGPTGTGLALVGITEVYATNSHTHSMTLATGTSSVGTAPYLTVQKIIKT